MSGLNSFKNNQAPPLWQQLEIAARSFQAIVSAGQSARTEMDSWPSSLRSGAQAILYHALRNAGRTQALLDALAQRRPDTAISAILCVALSLLSTVAGQAMYEPYTVVNQSVKVMRQHRKLVAQAGFVNAILRQYLRQQTALEERIAKNVIARFNYPNWWIQQIQKTYPEHWENILQAGNQRAAITLRINLSKITLKEYSHKLSAIGIAHYNPQQPCVLQLLGTVDIRQLPGYKEGWFSVQDAGAQIAAPLLLEDLPLVRNQPLLILDACAAPGGKTAHLMEILQQLGSERTGQVEIIAMDINSQRCQTITENLQRLQLDQNAQVICADAAEPTSWATEILKSRKIDLLLLDAPCSASGIVRRHPDIPWLRCESDIQALVQTQKKILHALWPWVAPGGKLLYSTCSIFPQEGLQQIECFLSHYENAQLLRPTMQLLPSSLVSTCTTSTSQNKMADHDGFFYALLSKSLQTAD